MKKKLTAIWVFLIVLYIVLPVGYSASEEVNFELLNINLINKNIFRNNDIYYSFNEYDENINSGWPLIFDKGDEDSASKILIDSEENIIVTGYTFDINSNESDILTIKYNSEGDEIWNVSYDGGKFDYVWDLTLDSKDNIIVLGFNLSSFENDQNFDFILHLVKYNKDGIELWNNSYLWENEKDTFPGGISTDSDDDIIMTGGSGDFYNASFNCWILKMNMNGDEIWNRTFDEDLISIGFDVVIDSNDDIFVGGLSASFFGQGWYIVKYDNNGNKKWSQRYNDGNQLYDMEIDSQQNIILTGHSYSEETESASWLTLKCDKDGKLLWKQEFDSIDNEYSEDAAIDSKDNIITIGPKIGEDYYEPCIIIYNKYGEEICMKKPNIDGILRGVTIDNSDNIIATGIINNSIDYYNADYYTCRFSDNTPPSATLEKPILGGLYIFDKKLIPLNENILIFGKITVKIIVDNQSDVNKTLFYLDNILVKSMDTPSYEWLWDTKTFGNHKIEIYVYDENNNINRETVNVWKFF
jgi:CTP:phosphocholine cytidylyltransferase-like protein